MIWRVRDRATFAAFARTQRRRHGPLSMSTVPAQAGHEDEPPRVAYQIGRRVGGAVVRNRVRRRLRALVHARTAHLMPGAAYLIGASPESAASTANQLGEALDALLATPTPSPTPTLSPGKPSTDT